MRFEIDVRLAGKLYRYSVGLDWPTEYREARIIEESLSVDGKIIFNREQSQIILTSDGSGGSFGLNWHVFALPVINERPPFTTIADLKVFFSSMVLIAPVPASMKGFSEEVSSHLEHDGSNYASCLRELLGRRPRAYSDFEKYVTKIFPDFSSIENVPRGESGTQLTVQFEQSEPYRRIRPEFDELSDGEKCFFLSAYLVASNADDTPVCCVWDEPDNHLSLSEVSNFIIDMRRMSNRGGQFIATTHHPETIRSFSDETTFVLKRKSHLDPTLPMLLSLFPREGDLVDALMRDEIIG